MARGPLTTQEVKRYREDGFVLARGMFDKTEIELLRRSAKDDKALDDHSFGKADDQGGVVRLSLWNHPGNGIYGMFARCRSLVDSAEALLEGEVYHYHSKMIMKEPRVGGPGPGTRITATGIRTGFCSRSSRVSRLRWTAPPKKMAVCRC